MLVNFPPANLSALPTAYATSMIFLSALIVKLDYSLMIV